MDGLVGKGPARHMPPFCTQIPPSLFHSPWAFASFRAVFIAFDCYLK